MAKYQVNHTCGHTCTHTLFGKGKDREAKLAWLETQQCTDCWRAEKVAAYEALNQEAAEQNKLKNLPELLGTPKQIAWAETIRAEKVSVLDGLVKKDYTPANAEAKELLDKVNKIIQSVRNQTDAVYWIENRTCYFDAYWLQKELNKQKQES